MLRIRRGEKRAKVPVRIAMVDLPIGTAWGIFHEKKTIILYEEVASPDQ